MTRLCKALGIQTLNLSDNQMFRTRNRFYGCTERNYITYLILVVYEITARSAKWCENKANSIRYVIEDYRESYCGLVFIVKGILGIL
jgi:hypothetical protein